MKLQVGKITRKALGEFFGVAPSSISSYWETTYSKKLADYADFHMEGKSIIIDEVYKDTYFNLTDALADLIEEKTGDGYFLLKDFCNEYNEEIIELHKKAGQTVKFGDSSRMVAYAINNRFSFRTVILIQENGVIREITEEDKKQFLEICEKTARLIMSVILNEITFNDYFDEVNIEYEKAYNKRIVSRLKLSRVRYPHLTGHN